jgi:hypothetical protein
MRSLHVLLRRAGLSEAVFRINPALPKYLRFSGAPATQTRAVGGFDRRRDWGKSGKAQDEQTLSGLPLESGSPDATAAFARRSADL